ncbi:MAG: ATP-dependent zinc metalloprotease FtsH [Vallitaleaceae bacterium]|jgi:cell division protease FtsH|nr:ATP-dependent zinc metalloprotease FtsH [Vallitaleaceae bacterium]
MKRNFKGFGLYAIILVVLLVTLIWSNDTGDISEGLDYGYQDLIGQIEADQVDKIYVHQNSEVPTGEVTVYLFDKTPTEQAKFFVPNVWVFGEAMADYDVAIYYGDVQRISLFWSILPTILVLGAVIILFFFIMNQAQGGGGGGNKVMSFGKSKAKMVADDDKKVTFANVAGLKEEKEDLEEIVDFLKSPRKYVELGARIPKGVLLVGPPGTGKTLLAKAISGEAGVPFFSISGSDFVEMFVGVGASRVRDLFEQAKKNSPCIVFIDEIDAVGRKRGAGLGGGHDEREQTLNQLLVEMDGFGVNEGVIIIAATNRVDILDPALLRPGRFDRKVMVGRPDVLGREQILKVHSKGKPLSDDVKLEEIAKTTPGFTGADLENLMNEAAIYAARYNSKVIKQEDLRRAFIKVAIGAEKKSHVISDKAKRITAYHEAGHAILHHVLQEVDDVHSISIIPTGLAGGYTMSLPGEDEMYVTKKRLTEEIIVLLGGRAAETLVIKDITNGASNDIERATNIARGMIIKYGMSEVLGPIQFGSESDDVFIGRDWGHTRNYGENVAGLIDSEIRRLVESGFQEAMRIIEKHMEALERVAQELLIREKIDGELFIKLFNNEEIPEFIIDPEKVEEAEPEKADDSKVGQSIDMTAEGETSGESKTEEQADAASEESVAEEADTSSEKFNRDTESDHDING